MKPYYILSKVCRKKKKYINGAEPVVALYQLERQFQSSTQNKKALTGITYLFFEERTLYLSSLKPRKYLYCEEILSIC
ncbi:hypothetical protein KQI67_29435 [Bacillus albus]|nr:hypothetical protein [Bacillus albus]